MAVTAPVLIFYRMDVLIRFFRAWKTPGSPIMEETGYMTQIERERE